MWKVSFDDTFAAEFDALAADVQDAIQAYARLLEVGGPQLGRPYADTLNGSGYRNMKGAAPDGEPGGMAGGLRVRSRQAGDLARGGREGRDENRHEEASCNSRPPLRGASRSTRQGVSKMPVPLETMLDNLAPKRRAAVEQHAERLIEEYRSLAQIRKALGLTQKDVANALETSQANVAQIERTPDALVSTLERVVRAMGGELELVASIPGHGQAKLRLESSNARVSLRPVTEPKKAGKKSRSARPKEPRQRIAMREGDLEYDA
jgi:transcriptional regulator with XRE-family HTH domain